MAASEPKVSVHFPARPKRCEKRANLFFECFAREGRDALQPDATQNCIAQLTDYNSCVERVLGKEVHGKELHRVAQAYRS